MYNYEIQIAIRFINGSANFVYDPSVLRTVAGDTVTWVCQDGPFAIEFAEDTPVESMDASGQPTTDGRRFASDQLTIRQDARGHYHYAVAVSLVNQEKEGFGRVVLDAACPEIIVK